MAFVTRKFAPTGAIMNADTYYVPVAPGAVSSPQEPGQVPDRSSVPERGTLPVPVPNEPARRPLTQYGTSQEIMAVYDKEEMDPTDPRRFVQAPPSYEEQRTAFAGRLRTPMRPTAGYALSDGQRMANDELAALSAEAAANQPLVPGE
jgi:hypothetical protein